MDKELEEAIKRIETSLERPGILGTMRRKDWEIILNYVKNSIPKQAVVNKIQEINKAYEDSKDERGESEYYYPDYTIEKLEELLEGK